MMISLDKAVKIREILKDNGAVNTSLLHVCDESITADYFVIAVGESNESVKLLAAEVEKQLQNIDVSLPSYEGKLSNNWVILDYNDVIVHVFSKEAEDFYSLEVLWDTKVSTTVQE